MTDMRDEAKRGDIEPTLRDVDDSDAKLRTALEKDRQRAQQVRRNARATYRAREGWQRVRSEEGRLKVCGDSRDPSCRLITRSIKRKKSIRVAPRGTAT